MFQETKLKIHTSDIPTSWLNARCRNLISKYALIAFRHDGRVFDLRSDKILSELSKHSKTTNHQQLKTIYQQLKDELRTVLADPALKAALTIKLENIDHLKHSVVH